MKDRHIPKINEEVSIEYNNFLLHGKVVKKDADEYTFTVKVSKAIRLPMMAFFENLDKLYETEKRETLICDYLERQFERQGAVSISSIRLFGIKEGIDVDTVDRILKTLVDKKLMVKKDNFIKKQEVLKDGEENYS